MNWLIRQYLHWDTEPEEVQILPGTAFPTNPQILGDRNRKLEAAIQYLGPKYCLHVVQGRTK
jgi:hypothetical protein